MSTRAAGVRLLVAGGAFAALSSCAHLVILHDPLSAVEHNDLGVAYEAGGQPGLAAREYHRALHMDAHQARARVNLGNADAARGRWHAAEKSYRRALRDSSNDGDAMNNLAIALLRRDRKPQQARAWAEHAVTVGGGA